MNPIQLPTLNWAIEVIKLIRMAYGIHLIEAKRFVDLLVGWADEANLNYKDVTMTDVFLAYRHLFLGERNPAYGSWSSMPSTKDKWTIFGLLVENHRLTTR